MLIRNVLAIAFQYTYIYVHTNQHFALKTAMNPTHTQYLIHIYTRHLVQWDDGNGARWHQQQHYIIFFFRYGIQCGLQLFWYFGSITWHTHTHAHTFLHTNYSEGNALLWCDLVRFCVEYSAYYIRPECACVCVCARELCTYVVCVIWFHRFCLWSFTQFQTYTHIEFNTHTKPIQNLSIKLSLRHASPHWISLDDASLFPKFIWFNLRSIWKLFSPLIVDDTSLGMLRVCIFFCDTCRMQTLQRILEQLWLCGLMSVILHYIIVWNTLRRKQRHCRTLI